MGIVSTLITAAVLAGPPVEVSTFAGGEHKGELKALEDGQLTLVEEGAEKSIPLDDVLELRLDTQSENADPAPQEVLLTDGTRLSCKQVTSTQKTVTLETTTMGTLELPADAVKSIRLAKHSNALAEDWTKLTERQENKDLLVVPKNDVLDFLSGVVGPISADKVQFLVGGNNVDVNRNKAFGIVYGDRKRPREVAVSRAVLPNQDAVELKSLKWTGEAFEGELVAGTSITFPPDKLASLDFSLGKVQFLSDLKPRQKKVEVPLAIDGAPPSKTDMSYYDVKINQNYSGSPLQLGNQTFPRGLCIHSKTQLTYRLSKEMRRFQAMMGIDNRVAQSGLGDVRVTIKADDETLLETLVRGTDEPQKLDLDVTDVVVLEITVDFVGEDDLGVGDHLVLGDAKLIK